MYSESEGDDELEVATFVERKSRLTIVKRLHGRDSQSMTQAVLELASQLQDKLKTLTVDHGKEFANYREIEEQTGINLYFAHAYSPHERGSNENPNRVLRRFMRSVRGRVGSAFRRVICWRKRMNVCRLWCRSAWSRT